jgi:hypothetical protein
MSGVYRRCRLVTLPPLPPANFPPPFPKAADIDTEPGVGLLAIKAELAGERSRSARYREERNALREELARSPSVPPPTRRQKAVGVSLGLGKWAVLLTLLPALGAAVAKRWPEYEGIVQAVMSVFAQ